MRILHVIGRIDPAWGGPPRVAVRLAAAQAALGHETHLLGYVSPGASDWLAEQRIAVPGGVNFHLLEPASLYERVTASRAKRILSPLMPNLDWVHIHGVWERALVAAADLAFAFKVPYCVRPAGMLDGWSLSQKKWKKRIAMALGYRRSLERAAFLHALTPVEAQVKTRLKLTTSCEVIPNGIDPKEIDPLPPQGYFRAQHAALGNRRFILFLARLHFKKGLNLLADAFRIVANKMPDVDLVVAGPDEGERKRFEQSMAGAGLSRRVHIVGPIYLREKFAALRDSACFCLPSFHEGFSVSILEALAVGVPVVISEHCNFDEVQRCGAGFVVRHNAAELAAGLLAVLADPANRDAMGAAGRAMVEERYTWDRVAAATLAAYEKYRVPATPAV